MVINIRQFRIMLYVFGPDAKVKDVIEHIKRTREAFKEEVK